MAHEDVELPRLLKKTGGQHLRVDTKDELAAALADGWCLKTPPAPKPTGIVITDLPAGQHGKWTGDDAAPFTSHVAGEVPDDASLEDGEGEDVSADGPAKRGPGRPRNPR